MCAAKALIGSIAKESTHVAEWVDGDTLVFDVATGMVEADAHFAPRSSYRETGIPCRLKIASARGRARLGTAVPSTVKVMTAGCR
jgi:endonuclease YncB( thermonuclease family)